MMGPTSNLTSLRMLLGRLVGVLALVLAVLILAAAMGTVMTSRNYRDAAQLSTQRASAVNQLLVDMLDAETGYRGYVLTGAGSYLQPYSQARARYPHDLELLQSLARGEPELEEAVRKLHDVATVWFTEAAEAINLRRRGRGMEAVDRVNQGIAKDLSDRFREQYGEVRAIVISIREEDLERADHARDVILAGITVLAILALVVLAGTIRRVWNQIGGPINQLALGVGRVTRGRLSDPVTVQKGSVRELAQLIRGFNAMQLQVFQQRDAVAAAARRDVAQQTERRLWETVQYGLLPNRLPSIPGFRVVGRYHSAESALLVGGDFYDAMALPDGCLAVLVGDVAGHGATSAAQAAGLRFGWRTMVAVDPTPTRVVEALNAQMARHALRVQGIFASLIYALISPDGSGHYVRAGHPRPILLGGDGCQQLVHGDRGPLLGTVDEANWPEIPVQLQPGETLVLFTDGLIEAGAPEIDEFGVERVCDVLYSERKSAVQQRLERAVEAARRHDPGRSLRDDVVVVAVERIMPL